MVVRPVANSIATSIANPIAGDAAAVSYDADASSYFSAVATADGQELSTKVKNAVNALVLGLKSDGIWDDITQCGLFAGPVTIDGALVKLKGSGTITNNGFVDGDVQSNGLQGDGTSYIDTGVNHNTLSQNDNHICVYVTVAQSATVFGGYYGAGSTSAGASNAHANANNTATYRSMNASAYGGLTTGPYTGLLGTSRSTSTAFTVRENSTDASAAIASTTAFNGSIEIFTRGSGVGPGGMTLSWYSFGAAISLADLDSRLDTYMAAIA